MTKKHFPSNNIILLRSITMLCGTDNIPTFSLNVENNILHTHVKFMLHCVMDLNNVMKHQHE
jgi:hypothetical protein